MKLQALTVLLCVVLVQISAMKGRDHRDRPENPAGRGRGRGRGRSRTVPGYSRPVPGYEVETQEADPSAGASYQGRTWRVRGRPVQTSADGGRSAYLDRLLGIFNRRQNIQQQQTVRPREKPKNETTAPHSGEWIRLRAVRGFMNAGIVEVYRAGRWGVVCDDAWDVQDARVACRQLGFKQGANSAPGEAYYGLPDGRWGNSDIIMDDVNCQGSEATLQQCDYSAQHDCRVNEAASVVCKPNTGCPEDWVPGPDGCYRFFGGAKNYKAAAEKCGSMNASLVSIESAAENHFLSNLITLTATDTEHVWYTAARNTKQQWKWYTNVFRVPKSGGGKGNKRRDKKDNKDKKGRGKPRGKRRAQRSRKNGRMRTQRAVVGFKNWFPGWVPSSFGQEPTEKKGHTCVVLTDLYELPNGTVSSADYYFWKAERCTQRGTTISFICEMKAQEQPDVAECITGLGDDYRGFMDHTDIGTPCIQWNLAGLNEKTHPGKGLGEHNYCRNPDNDQRPWCWVARGKFGFCPIPRCSATTAVTTTTAAPDMLNCPDDQFFCSNENQCIPDRYHCDGEADCDDGEDEVGCEYPSAEFEEYEDQAPQDAMANLTYGNLPLETCAQFCLDNTYFECVSFVYNADERKCELLDSAGANVYLIPSTTCSYYILRTETGTEAPGVITCSSSEFTCDDGHCVRAADVCNKKSDCPDGSDERDCSTTTPAPMSVRLAGGEEHSGRVEVNYLGEWGVVCDDQWDIRDARVVCRMLGYPGAVRASSLAEFGMGDGAIVLDEVQCKGNETSLQHCPASPWKDHNCQSFEAAGVVCQTSKTCLGTEFRCGSLSKALCIAASKVCDGVPTCPDASDEADCALRVELVNGTSPQEGRVEMIRNGMRGTVCDDEWGKEEADVICRMLGYRYGGEPVTLGAFGQGEDVIWMDEVACTGREASLADCSHPGWTINDCSHLEDAGVRCHKARHTTTTTTTTTTPAPEQVRVYLVDGPKPNEGRVELQVGRFRGTICDDSWDDMDAAVICRMAGYINGGVAVSKAAYGEGKADLPILLDEVECQGEERDILQCRHLGFDKHNCLHSEDAGVVCSVPGPAGGAGGQTSGGGGKPDTNIMDGAECGLIPLAHQRKRREAWGYMSDADAEAANFTLPPVGVEEPRYQKIVGGDMAPHGMYPWQVGIQKVYNVYHNGVKLVGHWCGGTIINRHWILSAAHCFKTLSKSMLMLRVGDHGQKEEDAGEQKFEVEELIMHAGYDRESHDNDIALLKVRSEDGQGIKFNDYAQPACLPAPDTIYALGMRCHISGWGEMGGGYPNILRAAKVPLQSFTTCNYLYKGELTRRMLCAGYLQGGIDTCQGDSGGPLVCELNGAHTLFGVTSWGFECAKPNAPGVYTKVTEFLSWIEDNIRRFS